MALKYSKAPISELIAGIIFNNNSLLHNGIQFELLKTLLINFPNINTYPARPEDDLIDGLIHSSVDYSKSGFSTYRLSTSDSKWQILLQQNVVTFHWSRPDIEPVGSYPGFTVVFNKFFEIYQLIKNLFSSNGLDFEKSIKNYYLNYVDRVNFEEYKSRGMSITDILNLSFPSFKINGKNYQTNNCYNRYSTLCDEINGNSIIGINTPTLPQFGQIIVIDNKLKGYDEKRSVQDWFKVAHDIQVSFFETIFTEKILNSWK